VTPAAEGSNFQKPAAGSAWSAAPWQRAATDMRSTSNTPACRPSSSELLSDPAPRPAVAELLAALPRLDIIYGYWPRAGGLRRSLLKRSVRARLADTLIAQSCLDHRVPLVTADRDFRHFLKHGLIVLPQDLRGAFPTSPSCPRDASIGARPDTIGPTSRRRLRSLRTASGGRHMSRPRILILLLITFLVSSVVLARGNAKTVRLDVAGGDLAKPVSVTNRTLLDLSHVYLGQFLGGSVDGVESQWPRYTVRLVFEPEVAHPDGGANRNRLRTYLIHYSLNRQTGQGYIYLPGPTETEYRENASVIIRDGHDGHWHRAEATWSSLLNPYLH
jgi:hypothetical protein